MNQSYRVPEGADAATLVEVHNEILSLNPDIRVVNRWGRFTEYDVKLKRRDAAAILDEADGDMEAGPWRLVFGADHVERPIAYSVDVQLYDAEKRYWDSTALDLGDPDAVLERAVAWLREHHPAAEALIEIDNRLLDDGLELREFIAHVRQLAADAGRSHRSIATELEVAHALVNRALDPENDRPSPEVTARVAAALGEDWGEERVWRRR